MKVISGKRYLPREASFSNLRELLDYAVDRYRDEIAYLFRSDRREEQGKTIQKTYLELREDIDAFAAALIERGILTPCEGEREHIAVIGANSYPWVVTYNAVLFGLGIGVPLDKQLSEPEISSLCSRGKVNVFAFDYSHRNVVSTVAKENPRIHHFILLDQEDKAEELKKEIPHLLSFAELVREGLALPRDRRKRFHALPIDEKSLMAIYFTSGTTSQSKGVMLSQQNIIANVRQGMGSIPLPIGSRTLSVLPLHHTFEATVGMHCLWALGNTLCINDSLRNLVKNLKEWNIFMMLTVPLMLSTVHRQILKAVRQKGKERSFRFAIHLSRFLLKLGIDVRRRLFSSIYDTLGHNLSWLVSGAAALSPELHQFFKDIGIDCLSGYGLTETSPMIAACVPDINIAGSVGPVMYDVTVAIDSESGGNSPDTAGEILIKGDNVMLGYYENEEATAAAFNEDGWFKTGDIGYFGEKDCLFITGRAKSVIVLSNGKNAFPEELEAMFGDFPGVKSVMIWGEPTDRGGVNLCARFEVDRENVPAGVDGSSDEEISAWLNQQVEQVNTKMTEYKKLKQFIWDDSAPIMTTTMKIKRTPELDRVHAALEASGQNMRSADGKRLVLN